MVRTSEVWIFCMICAAELAIEWTEGVSTTTKRTTTTTDSSGTIQVPVWVIYALVLPIIGFAALIGLVAICRWIIRKRKISVTPINESCNNDITNDLNNENENDKVMDNFVVAHESRKISSKPKVAVDCCLSQTALTSASRQGKEHPGIVRLNTAIEEINKERERKETMQHDIVSENKLNHLKKETKPKVTTPDIQSCFITTFRGASGTNTFKIETESEGIFQTPRTLVATNRVHKKQRKPVNSALRRNTRLLQSKLNRQTTEVSEETDTTTEVSSSSIFTESEEESEIDPSFAQSEEEDLTDDEDSCRDTFNSRYHKKKRKNGTLNEATAINLYEKHVSKPTNKKKEYNLIKSENTILKDKCTTASADKSLLGKVALANLAPTDCHGDHQLPVKHVSSTYSNEKQKKPNQISKYGHVPREGPIATSSFKATTDEKTDMHRNENLEHHINDFKDDGKHFDEDTKRDIDIDKKEKQCYLDVNDNDNYMKFEETIMILGKVNLNRSMSLNEADAYKHEFTSGRRKRKYQSLRQARKESVFDVLQKLDLAPKKSILKKSGSLHVKRTAVKTPRDNQMFRASNTSKKETILNNKDSDPQFTSKTHGHKLLKNIGCHVLEQNQKATVADITEKVTADRQTSDISEHIAQNIETFTSFNETEINGDEKVVKFQKQSNDLDVHSDVKDQKSIEILETKTVEPVAVIRPQLYHEDFQEKVDDVSLSKKTISFSGSAAGMDSTDLGLSRRNVSNRNGKEDSFSFDRLSPILPNQVTCEQAFLQTNGISYLETNVGHEKGESFSESTAFISSDSVTLDKVLQMKLRKKLIAFQSHRSEEMTLYDDVDLVDQTKESNAELFKVKAKTASENLYSKKNGEEENRMNVGKLHVARGDFKAFTKKNDQMNELLDASIIVSERDLLYTASNQNYMQASEMELDVHDETQQMINDLKSIKYRKEILISEQSTDAFKISKVKAPSVQKIGDTTQLAEISKIQQTKCSHHSDVGDITHSVSVNNEFTSLPTRSADCSQTPTLTTDTSSTTTLQDKYSINSPHQEHANLFPFSVKHTDNSPSLTEMLDKPGHDAISRQSLSEPKELKAISLKAITKPHPKGNGHPLLPYHRPKSADIFSRKADFLDTRPGMECIEQKNKNVDMANTIYSKQISDEFRNKTKRRHEFFLQPKSTSSKHALESKRSITPTFLPTYTSSVTEASNKKTLVAELKPKHQIFPLSKIKPDGLSVGNVEPFSRNLPTAPRASFVSEQIDRPKGMNRASSKSKKASSMPSYNTILLIRREKEKNILNGGINSKMPSERERPKSAMSLRSAPRPTYLETVHPSFDRNIRNNPFGHGNKSFQFPHSTVKQGMDNDKRANVILQANKIQLTDSDSELENFFANPDAEVLHMGSKDVKTNFIRDSEFTKRSKPSKSISFKM